MHAYLVLHNFITLVNSCNSLSCLLLFLIPFHFKALLPEAEEVSPRRKKNDRNQGPTPGPGFGSRHKSRVSLDFPQQCELRATPTGRARRVTRMRVRTKEGTLEGIGDTAEDRGQDWKPANVKTAG